ncbi:unnamed protein product [Rotaria sp. Silwood2]|nr:unnamed protein product [Rotaria sp. Silwood2]
MGVNRQFSKILRHPMFTSRLTLLRCLWNGFIFPLSRIVLDRFCLQILLEIHHRIQWLDLESLSMERILFAADYPNLRGLGLNIERLSFDRQLPMFSSTLVELHIKVQHFDDILYLLDGRFNKLQIFYVDVINVAHTRTSPPMINNKVGYFTIKQ